MDMTTLVRKVGRSFGDTDQIIILNTDIFDWVNEAQMKVVRDTGCLGATINTTAGAFPVALPVDFLLCKRVTYNNKPLAKITIDELDDNKVDRTVTGRDPNYFYIFGNFFNLYPADETADTTVVKIDYVKAPVAITTISDPIEIPINFHEDLVRFCVMRAHERNENYNAMQSAKTEFDAEYGQRQQDMNMDDDYVVIRDDPEEWVT